MGRSRSIRLKCLSQLNFTLIINICSLFHYSELAKNEETEVKIEWTEVENFVNLLSFVASVQI